MGRFILAARAFVAEIEREKISERTMRGKLERAKSGRIPQGTGRGMYGYIYNSTTGHREIVESQAVVVRRLFEEFAAGASIVGLANRLNDEEIPTFLGKKWHPASVHHLLKNSAYAGRTLYRRTRATSVRDPKTGRRRRQVAERPEAEWIEDVGASEAVVLPALWERVQERLADPEQLRMRHRQSTYALAGHIRCAKCGRSMVGQTLQGSYRYYRCRSAFAGPKHDRCLSRYVRANALKGAVKTAVAGVLANPEVVLAELERFRRANEEAPRTRDAELEQLEAQRKDVLGRYQLGQIDDGYLEEELARTRRETERIRSHPVRQAPNADGDYDICRRLRRRTRLARRGSWRQRGAHRRSART